MDAEGEEEDEEDEEEEEEDEEEEEGEVGHRTFLSSAPPQRRSGWDLGLEGPPKPSRSSETSRNQ
eukprot:7688343-Pyramimonas_sp.AAC.1